MMRRTGLILGVAIAILAGTTSSANAFWRSHSVCSPCYSYCYTPCYHYCYTPCYHYCYTPCYHYCPPIICPCPCPHPCYDFTFKLTGKASLKAGELDPDFTVEVTNTTPYEWGFYNNELRFTLVDEKGKVIPNAFNYPAMCQLIILPPKGTVKVKPNITLNPGAKLAPGKYTVHFSFLLKTATHSLTIEGAKGGAVNENVNSPSDNELESEEAGSEFEIPADLWHENKTDLVSA